ncbi:MAG: transglutaminase-like domain-containing protein, partial [Propionibacteriaceae bacterium]|jgi:hypothetical protein|nr:transglutaminase-like domain-containing protein [Propionibacteriaceae bacterium]
VPTLGTPDTLEFHGEGAAALQEGLYANRWAGAALTTGDLSRTAEYTLHTVLPPAWTDGQLRGLGTPARGLSKTSGVPEGVGDLARSIAARAQTQLDRVRAIETYLSGRGFFSNTDQSLPTHRADRINRMIEGEQMVGDDEQYAALMALMLSSMNIPARVVMGLHRENPGGGAAVLRGYDMHAWVEVEFEEAGWVAFDPTPPRDQVPETNTSKPRNEPRPQVLQPPEPPEDPVELPPSITDRAADNIDGELHQIPWRAMLLAGGMLLAVLSPAMAIGFAKWARGRKRRNAADPARSVSGSWDEVVDFAVDSGAKVPLNLTRQESAWLLNSIWTPGTPTPEWVVETDELPPSVELALMADTAVFSGQLVTAESAASAWRCADSLRREHDTGNVLTRTRRALSLRSLRRAGASRRAAARSRR